MPTKQELLEEKTVKELTQMARDKDLSGYSQMNKPGLVDLIKSNYTKAEIQDWPKKKEKTKKETKKEKKTKEPEAPKETEETETTEISKEELKKPKSVETVEVEGDFERVPRPQPKKTTTKNRWPIIAVIIVLVIIAIALIAWAVV